MGGVGGMEMRGCVCKGGWYGYECLCVLRGTGMEMSVCVEGEVLVHVCVLRESADL